MVLQRGSAVQESIIQMLPPLYAINIAVSCVAGMPYAQYEDRIRVLPELWANPLRSSRGELVLVLTHLHQRFYNS